MIDLRDFLTESNKIEGIETIGVNEPQAAQDFLNVARMDIPDLVAFVAEVEPGAELRNRLGLNVIVGSHRPPPGGTHITQLLDMLLLQINAGEISAYRAHLEYERIHPFTDGNGRSGRLLWLWQMQREGLYSPVLGFLHAFYYQTLRGSNE